VNDLKITYRGIDVPEDLGKFTPFNYAIRDFDRWKAGVDAALDAVPQKISLGPIDEETLAKAWSQVRPVEDFKPGAKRNLRVELDRLLYDWGCFEETYDIVIGVIESDAGRDGRDGVVYRGPKAPRQWHRTEDIPADVDALILSNEDSVAHRVASGGWLFDVERFHTGWDLEGEDFPVTEVIE
jgi:hypothetical protein